MFVLDTDVVSEVFRGYEKYLQRIRVTPKDIPITTTTVSRFEILVKGRYQAMLAAANREDLLIAQQRLIGDELHLNQFPIIDINDGAADHFERLRTAKGMRKIGRADLLIACITLAHDATLVTRNVKDFAKIPNLKIENWAK